MAQVLYGDIVKVSANDDGSLKVAGFASTEDIDKDGEIVLASAIRKALPSYMQAPAIRVMHRPIAAGSTTFAKVQDDGRTYIEGNIYDEETKTLVKAGVLRAFSVGGKTLGRDARNPKIINSIRLTEISLVDSPANPACTFTLCKFDKAKFKANRSLMFSELYKGDVSNEPRDSNGRWTAAGAHAAGLAAGQVGTDAYVEAGHAHLMAHDESYRSAHTQVIAEDRGTRRGRPWGSAAGAVAGAAAGAALGAGAPSRIVGTIGAVAAGSAVGASQGALRSFLAARATPLPARAALAAGGALAGAAGGAYRGYVAAQHNPKLASTVTIGAAGAVTGAMLGGATGEAIGAMHDRTWSTRRVEKAESTADLIKSQITSTTASRALAKFSPSQQRDQDGRFANEGKGPRRVGQRAPNTITNAGRAGPAANVPTHPGIASEIGGLAGGVAGDLLGHHLTHGKVAFLGELAVRAALGVAGAGIGTAFGGLLDPHVRENAETREHLDSIKDQIRSLKPSVM